MFTVLGLVILILVQSLTNVQAQKGSYIETLSPCPSDAFKINKVVGGPPGRSKDWSGIVLLNKLPNLSHVDVTLTFDEPVKVNVNKQYGHVEVFGNKYVIKYKPNQHTMQQVTFEVSGKPKRPLSFPTSILVNEYDICKIAEITEEPTTHTNTPTQVPIKESTTIEVTLGERIDLPDGNCGKRLVKFQGLITNGWPSQEGDWPWHAAIYTRKNRTNYNYVCGGTLISSKIVLTAAHCVSEYGHVILEDRFLVKVGQHNRQLGGRNTQELEVYEVISHEDFDISNLKNDIALLKLATQALLTNYVQPVCLWPSTKTGLEEVINKNGIVVGWGLNEEDQLVDILTQGRMPVVSLTTCLESNRDFFGLFISDYVYCAGFRNGTSVCNGDSGGGMVFERDGTYYLRGIVSLSVSREDKDVCNPKQFVVFTDAAKYLNWIEINMN